MHLASGAPVLRWQVAMAPLHLQQAGAGSRGAPLASSLLRAGGQAHVDFVCKR